VQRYNDTSNDAALSPDIYRAKRLTLNTSMAPKSAFATIPQKTANFDSRRRQQLANRDRLTDGQTNRRGERDRDTLGRAPIIAWYTQDKRLRGKHFTTRQRRDRQVCKAVSITQRHEERQRERKDLSTAGTMVRQRLCLYLYLSSLILHINRAT